MHKIEDKKPSERLLEIVIPIISKKGFEYKKSKKEFVRKFPFGKQIFSISFDGRGGLTTVDCGLFIVFDELIKIYGEIFEKPNNTYWQVGEARLSYGYEYSKRELCPGFLFDSKFGAMTLIEKSKYNTYEVHPEFKIRKGADFITCAYELFAETTFEKLNSYEHLFDFYLESIEIRNKKIKLEVNCINLFPNEEMLVYYSLILALCLLYPMIFIKY